MVLALFFFSEKQLLSTSFRAPNLITVDVKVFPFSVVYLWHILGECIIMKLLVLGESFRFLSIFFLFFQIS